MITKKLTTTFQYILLICGGFFCLLFVYFFVDSASYEDRVYRNTYIAGIDVSGLAYSEFITILEELQKDVEEKQVVLLHEDIVIEVRAADVGLGFDEGLLWDQVYQPQKRDSMIERFIYWLQSFGNKTSIQADTFAREHLLNKASESWKEQIPQTEPFNGDLRVVGVTTELQLPTPGYMVDIERLKQQVLQAFITGEANITIPVPLVDINPERSIDDIIAIQKEVDGLIGLPLTLYSKEYPNTLVLGIKDISEMIRVSVPKDPQQKVIIDIDDEVLVEKLAPLYPREASFVPSEDGMAMELIPSSDGFDIDMNKTVKNILHVGSRSSDRKVEFEIDQYIEASFTTEDAEALNIKHLVSQFTTYHGCCAARVENIHLVADILDGKILKPGEILNMNEFLGERTEERGFKPAGTIIKGRLEETVGGGISQFITTLHNAVYWGGYQVVAHKPHTLYFSRYPQGIEATINWPYVDYIFKNDTENGLYVDVSYTDTSITVSFYGDNHGRIAIGDHKGGYTNMKVSGATENSRFVISEVSPRYNYKEPLIHYIPDEALARGEEVYQSVGDARFSVNVVRTVREEGELVRVDVWPVHYQQDSTIVRRNPCDFYDEEFDYGKC